MSDVHSPEIRSYNMSRIKGKDTKPEILVRKFLFANGLRYRLHDKSLPGKPDLSFSKYKIAVFINGCFWHGHQECKYFIIPKTRSEWWMDKISRNAQKDSESINALEKNGWTVITIWECELKSGLKTTTLNSLIDRIVKYD